MPYGLLSYHLMVAGFAFYVFISYFYGVLGRFSQRLGLVTASLFYGGGIVFAVVAALYLYVTGRYLSGTFNFSVYTTYLFVESVMGLAGTAAGVAGAWRFRQVKPVETGVASFTGVEVIDEEIGFRHPSIVVVSGPPGSGRTTVLTKLAATRLAAGDSVASPSTTWLTTFVSIWRSLDAMWRGVSRRAVSLFSAALGQVVERGLTWSRLSLTRST